MANVTHASLTGADLHEPKGVATATNNQVYVADGTSSGAWTNRQHILISYLEDVSTAETVYIPIPFAGTISKVTSVLTNAITVADSTVTIKNSSGTTMGTITVAFSGSAAGDVDTNSSLTNNTVSADTYITIETNGNSNTASKLWLAVVLDRS